jgi:alkylhydroperoxidase family enzyme
MSEWTAEQRALATKYLGGGRPDNSFSTLIRVPALVEGTKPFEVYITRDSTLSARERELLILRTAWLMNNPFTWAEHVPRATAAGLTAAEIRRIASGPDGAWNPDEVALLRLADQLFKNSAVTNDLWAAIASRRDVLGVMDAVMTVADFISLSLLYNSLGVQPDASWTDRLPDDVPYRVIVPAREADLTVPRVEPVPGTGLGVGRTFARHPKLAQPRNSGSNYVNSVSKLEPRLRELLILRTGWNCRSDYEWAQHVGRVGRAREMGIPIDAITVGPTAPPWNAVERTVLLAADELYRDSSISDATWAALSAHFDTTMMMNVVITAANYRMVSVALNALGVQLDPGDEKFPTR